VRSALLQDYRPPRSPAPTSLRIDAIGLVAPVAAVGVEADGRSIEVPADVGTIGWYRFGPVPGADGSAVLLGHVDSHVQGAGAFFRLRELRPGDLVTVRFADDARASFRVVGRRSFPKDELPTELFHRGGRPVLTLVTCGGAFDETTRTYADNVVVFAVPAA
jgi:sortase (surface protein transpeptidase)